MGVISEPIYLNGQLFVTTAEVVSIARIRIVGRVVHQAPHDWVIVHVTQLLVKLVFRIHIEIVEAFLPKLVLLPFRAQPCWWG